MLDLDAIKARAEAATPGPWIGSSVPSGRKYGVISVKDYGEWTRHGARPLAVLSGIPTHGRHPDTQFIAHARTDIPDLLVAIDELEARRNHWNDAGDLVVETRTLFRQVGWQGHRAGDFYPLDSRPQDTEPGGFSPVYIQVGD